MDNINLILGILVISAILYLFVSNNSNKECFRTFHRSSAKVICKPKRKMETYELARMLEKRGTVLKPNGSSCFIDIDCASRYCNKSRGINSGICASLCSPKTSGSISVVKRI